MIRSIVVEGRSFHSEEISMLFDDNEQIRIEKTYNDPLQALEEAKMILPHVVFADTNMSTMDGPTFAEKYLEKTPYANIVFISASRQYAVRAFEVRALDYIVKPVKPERFKATKERIESNIAVINGRRQCGLIIKCFNRLNVYINEKPLKWPRVKAEELFGFLLMNHDQYVHKDIIIDNIWPGYMKESATCILQTTICDIRKVLSAAERWGSINYKSGSYQLKLDLAECDLIEMERVLKEFRSDKTETYKAVEKCCQYYGKGFMAQNGYLWSIERDQEILNQLTEVHKRIANNYAKMGMEKERINILKLLSSIVPYEEDVNNMLLNALKNSKRYDEMGSHYEWLEEVLKKEYDTEPASSTRNIANMTRIFAT